MADTGFEIPKDSRNISHDFRIAVFSFTRPFSEVRNYKIADLILFPSGVTSVSFSCSTATAATGGEFGLLGGHGSKYYQTQKSSYEESKTTETNEAPSTNQGRSETLQSVSDLSTVESLGLDLGSMFANTQHQIKVMDYIAIYTKDPFTNIWYGSTSSSTEIPEDAKPKFRGIVTDISLVYNATLNQMVYSIKFKSLLRLLELARFSLEKSMMDLIERISGKDLGSTGRNTVLYNESYGVNIPPHKFLKEFIRDDYPESLIGDRIEEDSFRIMPTSQNFLEANVTSIQSSNNYETKLNKLRQAAGNKDFEFFADEDGTLVWKLPTYARGINKKYGNYVDNAAFDPDNPKQETTDSIYHIHSFLTMNINFSETEIINVATGPMDYAVHNLGQTGAKAVIDQLRYVYFIRGTETESEIQKRFGYVRNGIRSTTLRNAVYYNALIDKQTIFGQTVTTGVQDAQMFYYDFKLNKNNISRYCTASLSMIDDPKIQVGMPVIVPLLAEAGVGESEGRLVPCIFYISALSRRYEFNKYPLLTLTLTHGRVLAEEFTNGIHMDGALNSWAARIEPSLFWDVPREKGFIYTSALTTRAQGRGLLDFQKNDRRIQEIISLNKTKAAEVIKPSNPQAK